MLLPCGELEYVIIGEYWCSVENRI